MEVSFFPFFFVSPFSSCLVLNIFFFHFFGKGEGGEQKRGARGEQKRGAGGEDGVSYSCFAVNSIKFEIEIAK